jgi:hypothetical protein
MMIIIIIIIIIIITTYLPKKTNPFITAINSNGHKKTWLVGGAKA